MLGAVDTPEIPAHYLLGVAHSSLHRPGAAIATIRVAGGPGRGRGLLRRRGWTSTRRRPDIDDAADAIAALRALGQDDLVILDTYADAAELVAAREVDAVIARGEPAPMVEGVITGTILGEAVLNALRLLAQQDASAGASGGRRWHNLDVMSTMSYRRLGQSGLTVSVVGVGCNEFGRKVDAEGTRAVVEAALDVGINFFDTADIYGGSAHGRSEEYLGAALKHHRDDVILATKFGMDMEGVDVANWGARGSRRYVMRAVEASLRRLDTDHIDLYQLHEPDPAQRPIEETLSALDDLVRAGKVRYVGMFQFRRLAGRRRRRGSPAPLHLNPVDQRPERLLSAQPGRRGGVGAGVPAVRPRGSCPSFRWPVGC